MKKRKKIHSLQVPVTVAGKYQLYPSECLVCAMLDSPRYASLPFPKAWQPELAAKVLCHRQQEGSCQVSGSLAVAAVGSSLFSCFALACRLGLLLSSVLVKAAGSFETFASRQQAATHSS